MRELQVRLGMVPDGHPSRAFLDRVGVQIARYSSRLTFKSGRLIEIKAASGSSPRKVIVSKVSQPRGGFHARAERRAKRRECRPCFAADRVLEEAGADRSEPHSGLSGTAIAVTAVGIGAVAFEAALLPGVILGVAAMLLPQMCAKHSLRSPSLRFAAFTGLVKSRKN